MHTYPVDERLIFDVEQGRSCQAIVPLPPDGSLSAGDAVLFAHSVSRPGQPPSYVKGGDSIAVSLTGVTDLGTADPLTGRALVQLTWKPLGREGSPDVTTGRSGKPRRSRGDV